MLFELTGRGSRRRVTASQSGSDQLKTRLHVCLGHTRYHVHSESGNRIQSHIGNHIRCKPRYGSNISADDIWLMNTVAEELVDHEYSARYQMAYTSQRYLETTPADQEQYDQTWYPMKYHNLVVNNQNYNNASNYAFPIQQGQKFDTMAYDPGPTQSDSTNIQMPHPNHMPAMPRPPPHSYSFGDHPVMPAEVKPTNRYLMHRHTRNSSWSSPKPHHAPTNIYQHQNNTVDNISTASRSHQNQYSTTVTSSSDLTGSLSDRNKRMGQVYGLASLRNPSSTSLSSTVSAVPSSSLAQLKLGSRNSSSSSLRSGQFYHNASGAPPLPPMHESVTTVSSSYSSFRGGQMSTSSSNSSLHSKMRPMSNVSSSQLPSQPAVPSLSPVKGSQKQQWKQLPPLETSFFPYQVADSGPASAATTTSIRDLVTPPTPMGGQSVTSVPLGSPSYSFSLPKLFSGRKTNSRATNSRASSNVSRSSSPSFVSRIGSRISTRLSSRFGSRLSSGANSPSNPGSSSLNPNNDKYAIAVTQGADDDWPEFTPRRGPQPPVLAELGALGSIHGSLVDIDITCRQAPLNTSKLGLQDEPEIRGFLARGIYYHQLGGGTTDEDGNYRHEQGEHIGYRYKVEGLLGKGSFGTVLKCRDHKSGRMVAVKITANRPELHNQAKIEANMLRALMVDHQGQPELHHFVRFVEHFRFKGHYCIATEMLGPNLYELLKRNNYKGLGEASVRYITRQLCEGLEFLADQGIIHCDLKPENILISDVEQCQVKIVDFGSGCYEGKRLYTYIQSRFYRAPEILLGMPYSFGIDTWSLGAIVPELLLGKPLFPSVDEADQVTLMAQVLGSPDPSMMWRCSRAGVFFNANGQPFELRNSKGEVRGQPGSTPIQALLSNFSNDAVDFVESTLRWTPEARLKANKAVYHPFVLGH